MSSRAFCSVVGSLPWQLETECRTATLGSTCINAPTARAKASQLSCSIGQAEYGERWGEGAARELDCILRGDARGLLEDVIMEQS